MKFQGRTLPVDVQRDGDRGDEATTYRLLAGEHCETSHHGEPVAVAVGDDVRLRVPPPPRVDRVAQPFGRAAHHRT